MVKKDIVHDERGAACCKFCARKKKISFPRVVNESGLYYARCPGCNNSDNFDYLGLSEKKAIRVWNTTMEGKGCTNVYLEDEGE